MKDAVFNQELNMIKDERIKQNLSIILELLPDYFYNIPASTTGKYHPSFALGHQGLIRHTKVATRIAYDLFQLEMFKNAFNSREQDLLIFSLIIHDGLKCGLSKEQYTTADHPIQIRNFLDSNKEKLSLTDVELEYIKTAVEAHMGEWNKDYQGNEILPKPTKKHQKFVHMCDYLSSKKYLDVKFDKDNNIM